MASHTLAPRCRSRRQGRQLHHDGGVLSGRRPRRAAPRAGTAARHTVCRHCHPVQTRAGNARPDAAVDDRRPPVRLQGAVLLRRLPRQQQGGGDTPAPQRCRGADHRLRPRCRHGVSRRRHHGLCRHASLGDTDAPAPPRHKQPRCRQCRRDAVEAVQARLFPRLDSV